MNSHSHFWMVLVILLAGLASCDLFEDSADTSGSGNLLRNSSFEVAGGPSIEAWDSSTDSVERHLFSQDTPPSGGKYSVGLRCDADIPASITQRVVLKDGFPNGIRLTFWTKTDSFPSPLLVHVIRGTTFIASESFIPHELQWAYKTFDLNFEARAGDSIFVTLMGGIMLSRDTTYWDQVSMYGIQ